MKYSYKFKLNRSDMFKYYMSDRYSSLAGIVQIIFTVSLIILAISKWNVVGIILKIILIVGISLFTIIQPLFFYINAGKSIKKDTPDTEILFEDEYIEIKVLSHIQRIRYQNIVQIINKPLMLIIQPDNKHIYILTNRILNGTKKDLYKFLKTKVSY